ncbi:signal recognition particle-docking protein FtsY [Shouchella lonarensis]|uniref:Signal recognition particle receptor FtsY n=1 Tax=Shouchella lonarensis TaxID=1464122 RepID=A0A1G6LAP8_9BACI|nr:signal recognition particle-docking protein FtsY [Shouchella lonarensis]SDC40360.1 signal recognition particle-docking protein FtsY [Shouchella lonarensis]
MSFFKKLKEKMTKQTAEVTDKFKHGLEKTRTNFSEKMNALVARYRKVDEDFFEELEELFIGADVGVTTVMTLVDSLREEAKLRNLKETKDLLPMISEKLAALLEKEGDDLSLHFEEEGLTVFLVVGVNGVGKTTSIGKLAHRLTQEGKSVVLAAGDTFRAGAIEQLEVWGERVGVPVIKQQSGSDPAAVMYDAIQAARARKADVLICDTAGRLQNKVNLMNELAKVKRVIEREVPGAPHEVLLVLDATTGQNALSQAKMFGETTDVSGLILTKLDGTAKGGIVMAIRQELDLPVKFIGLGEQKDDLQPFCAEQFVYGLFKELVEEEGA